ncbi:MAG: UbiD family decarboxylase [Syntrophobacterales bacterium]|nr:MAG: UbiD family decarboxylase [Syntrophobacterales bacterium]
MNSLTLDYGATLWQQLLAMRIPGIKDVYCVLEGSGIFLVIISLNHMLPRNADQVLTAAISTER